MYINEITQASPWYCFRQVLAAMGTQITGMYPTLIIVIVNLHRSFLDAEPSKISNGVSLNTLPWSVKRRRLTDTLGTEDGVEAHHEIVIDISPENSRSMVDGNVKELPSLPRDDV
jgi:hypothetical protein